LKEGVYLCFTKKRNKFILKQVSAEDPEEIIKYFEFMRELNDVTHHSIKPIDWEIYNDTKFILMEFWGKSLAEIKHQHLNHNTHIDITQLIEWISQSLEVFVHGEKYGATKRLFFSDIKPDNFVVHDLSNVLKVIDLPIQGRYQETVVSKLPIPFYTPQYAAPEIDQYRGVIPGAKPVKIDVFAFGMSHHHSKQM
jgi:serine/threonine protein kinase